jgi:rhodanese-related sulfurtransferase
MQTVTTIHITDFANLHPDGLPDGVLLLDVRTPAEYHDGHLDGALNVPLSELDNHLGALRGHNLVYIYCRTGRRSHNASEILMALGFNGIINLSGGMVAWGEQYQPTTANRRGLSIDRQFKLIAGLGVILSVLLSQWVHIGWIGVALFIGSGLTFAGASGICLLVILLAKMPWNRREVQATTQQAKVQAQLQ